MSQLNISADIADVTKMLGRLADDIVPKAASRSINRALTPVVNISAREISKQTGIKPLRKIKAKLGKQRSRPQYLVGVVQAQPYAPNLINYVTPAKRTYGAFHRQPGVKAKAWGKPKIYKGAFIGKGKNSGKPLVFARQSEGRNAKLKALRGPSIPKTFQQAEVEKQMRTVGIERFRKEYYRDIRYRLSRI